ncbi:hypothetical protein BJX96DRAFT_85411 [Aspergillus floccosus]
MRRCLLYEIIIIIIIIYFMLSGVCVAQIVPDACLTARVSSIATEGVAQSGREPLKRKPPGPSQAPRGVTHIVGWTFHLQWCLQAVPKRRGHEHTRGCFRRALTPCLTLP